MVCSPTRRRWQRSTSHSGPSRKPSISECSMPSAEKAGHLPQEDYRPRWKQALEHGLNDAARRPHLLIAVRDALQGSDIPNILQDPMRLANGPPLPLIDLRMERLLLDSRSADDAQATSWW